MLRDIFKGAVASAYRQVFGTAGQSLFVDSFNRTDGSINPAEDGSTYEAVRGTFQVSGNKASSLTDSNYPIAAIQGFTPDATVMVSGTTGTGAALWVTDSGNWWAVGITQQPESCNCVEYYNSYTYTYSYSYISGYNAVVCNAYNNSCCSYYTNCVAYNSSNCCGYTCYGYNTSNCCGNCCYGYNAKGNCKGYYCCCYNGSNCQGNYCSCYNGSNCAAYSGPICGSYSGCNNCISYSGGNANYATGYANATGYSGPYYNCETCYPTYIKIFQSVNNVVSTVASNLISAVAQSLKITTSGEQITIKAYSDTAHVSQIGSDIVYNATGATLFPKFGLTVVPSDYGQTYDIDSVQIGPDSIV